MKKLILLLILLFTLDISAQVTRASLWEWVTSEIIKARTGVTTVQITNLNLTDDTDTYKMLVSSDKWTLRNDAGSPATLMVVDSLGQMALGTTPRSGFRLSVNSGISMTGDVSLDWNGGDVRIGKSGFNLIFSNYNGSLIETFRTTGGNEMLIGTTTDAGGYKLQVAGGILGTLGATEKLLLDGSTTGHTDTAGLLDLNMTPTQASTGTVMADLALSSPSAGFGATTHYGINLSFTGDSDDNASSIVQLIQLGFTPNSSPTTVYGLYGNDSDLDYFIFEDGGASSRFDGTVLMYNNANALQLGDDASDVDIVMNWKANSNDGSITYMEDEDRFDVDNDFKIGRYLYESVTAGITAGTTQSQGQQALVTSINEVATVANANDVVTMPTAVAGLRVTIINNGANTLQIFPASGDNLGAGVDTSVTLVAGSNVTFVAYDATNWEQL